MPLWPSVLCLFAFHQNSNPRVKPMAISRTVVHIVALTLFYNVSLILGVSPFFSVGKIPRISYRTSNGELLTRLVRLAPPLNTKFAKTFWLQIPKTKTMDVSLRVTSYWVNNLDRVTSQCVGSVV